MDFRRKRRRIGWGMALELVASFRDAKKDSQALSSVIFSLELEGAKEKGGGHSGGGIATKMALWFANTLADGLCFSHSLDDKKKGRRRKGILDAYIRRKAAGARAGILNSTATHCSRQETARRSAFNASRKRW